MTNKKIEVAKGIKLSGKIIFDKPFDELKQKLIKRFQEFIEEHIIEDEIDGIERTLVEFNYNEWIRFKKEIIGGGR